MYARMQQPAINLASKRIEMKFIPCFRVALGLSIFLVSLSTGVGAQQKEPSTQKSEAIEQALAAVNANQYSPEAQLKLAEAYAHEGAYQEAIGPYRRAIELKPALKAGYLGLTNAYKHLGQRD